MSGLTVGQVRAWEPSTLVTTSDEVRRARTEVEGRVGDLARGVRSTRAGWTGRAAEAMERHARRSVRTGDDLARTLHRAAAALAEGSERLTAARSALTSLVAEAEYRGFTIADDGTVTPPPLPRPVGLPPSTAPGWSMAEVRTHADEQWEAGLAALDAEAQQVEQTIKAALVDARAADQSVCDRLAAITLPAAITDRADALADTTAYAVPPAMSFDGWEPGTSMHTGSRAAWNALVAPSGHCLWGPEGTGYLGGGFITGPDGRDYPLVVPQYVEDGHPYRADLAPTDTPVTEINGQDPGWTTIGQDTGIAKFGEPLENWETGAVFGSKIISGPGPTDTWTPRKDLLSKLAVSPTGWPALSADPPSLPSPRDIPPSDPRSNPIDRPPETQPTVPGYHPDRAGRIGGGISLAVGAAEGAAWLAHQDDHRLHAYTTTFEQHHDGRYRAMLRLYDVFDDHDGKTAIVPTYAWMDREGMQQTGMTFRPPPDHDVLLPLDPYVDQRP